MAAPDASPIYSRILLKLSGEALMGDRQFGIDPAVATRIAQDVAEIQALGVETAIVIGGGNIFRGVTASGRGMDRATAGSTPNCCSPISASPESLRSTRL